MTVVKVNRAYDQAVAAIDGHRQIADALRRAQAALADLVPVDVIAERARLVEDIIGQLGDGPAAKTLDALGAAWAQPERAVAELDAKRTALGQTIETLSRREQASVTSGRDTALADLDRQLADLLAGVAEQGATGEQVASYDQIRTAQHHLAGGGQRAASAIVEGGLFDRPELINPHVRAELDGTAPWPAPIAGPPDSHWWPTADRPAYLTWLARHCPARPCVPTQAAMRATAIRVREAVAAAQIERVAGNRYQPRVVGDRG